MKKRGPAWDVIKRVEGNTRADTADIRRVWADADTVEEFITELDADQLVLTAALVTIEGPDFARAARAAVQRIVREYGNQELRDQVTLACGRLDGWDGERRLTLDDWSDLDFVPSMLIQNTEIAFGLNTVRSFPAVFNALFTLIGQDRTERSKPIVIDHLGNFVRQAVQLAEAAA